MTTVPPTEETGRSTGGTGGRPVSGGGPETGLISAAAGGTAGAISGGGTVSRITGPGPVVGRAGGTGAGSAPARPAAPAAGGIGAGTSRPSRPSRMHCGHRVHVGSMAPWMGQTAAARGSAVAAGRPAADSSAGGLAVRSLPHTRQLVSPGSSGALQMGQVITPAPLPSGAAACATKPPAVAEAGGSGIPGGTAMVGAPGTPSAAGACGRRASVHRFTGAAGGDALATNRSPQLPQKRSPG